MAKRRRRTRSEPPRVRLEERLTGLENPPDRVSEPPPPAPDLSPPEVAKEVHVLPRSGAAHENGFGRLDVPEAEVEIVRRTRGAPVAERVGVAAKSEQMPEPSSLGRSGGKPAAGHPPARRGAFEGVVEEATVEIIRRQPRQRSP